MSLVRLYAPVRIAATGSCWQKSLRVDPSPGMNVAVVLRGQKASEAAGVAVINGISVTMKSKPTVLPAREFKAKCLAVLDDVERHRRTVIVTKRGRPVAQVVPLPQKTASTLRGSLVHEEDPLAPVDVPWEANA
jgi:prevent-host-death family protein